MQYFVFGAVWLSLVVGGFLIAGPATAANLKRLNANEFNPKASHQIHFENNVQLLVITILLAGILAVLIATLLVR